MGIIGFLNRPQHVTQPLNIVSWNVSGCKTKLEKKNVEKFLLQYDIVALNEVKTPLPVCLPGYVSYMSYDKDHSHRGGTTVLMKIFLSPETVYVDTSIPDQVWFKLKIMPKVVFGACYIPPSDSPYFSHREFASLQERLIGDDEDNRFLIIGDLNTRFGRGVREISNSEEFSYPTIPDDVNTPNDNAYVLTTLCKDNDLLVINNLRTYNKHFVSNKTYKQGSRWVSELDVCVGSLELINFIDRFQVHQTENLPSDHAPVSIQMSKGSIDLDFVSNRASLLGGHASLIGYECSGLVKKPIKYNRINHDMFNTRILDMHLNTDVFANDRQEFASTVSNVLYQCSKLCQSRMERIREENGEVYADRWDCLLQDHDDSRVWRAIDWKGKFQVENKIDKGPTDEEFKEYFERVLNTEENSLVDEDMQSFVNVPILDDLITVEEVQSEIKKIKADKACGPDGVPPGVLRMLPVEWLLTLATLFNAFFLSASYPSLWSLAKFFTVFKKGNRQEPKNYRGITVINCLAKLYDMILCSRLETWFKPYREQAGAQRGRGCIEHIVTLRLLTDMARKKKEKLFVVFVDFTQAYDLVPRGMLFKVLKRLGCGAVMLAALIAIYRVTNSIIGTAIITTTIGVRQGSSTSCLLFILYINDLIKLIKTNCNPDGFLSWLHILVLMDDTVLLATTRESIVHKISLLKQYCDTYGMRINVGKTKFFVICGTAHDSRTIELDGLIVEPCTQYVYLGSIFTADGSVSSSVAAHARSRMAHINKFVSFLSKNNDIPFVVKKRVFDAALMSAVLYGCESWLNADLRPIIKLYNWGLKLLLGVRKTTCNDLCYIESGYPPLQDLVRSKQRRFFSRMWRERSTMDDDPLVLSIKTVLSTRYGTQTYIHGLINENKDDVKIAMETLKDNVNNSPLSSRKITYREINPDLLVHNIYSTRHNVSELDRVSFTRFRVASHSLAVEVGRWSRRGRGRLPLEERLCICGAIQTEVHVVQMCPMTQNIRDSYNVSSIGDIFSNQRTLAEQCKIINLILSEYL